MEAVLRGDPFYIIIIFYKTEMWPLTLRELRLVENRLLRRTFGSKRSQDKFM
jgi:hypothetical protein